MGRTPPFRLIYQSNFVNHLRRIDARYRAEIRSAIEQQLTFDANVETRNRKKLKQPMPFDARWELRCGLSNRFRVFYSVNEDEHSVSIVALGEKDHEKIRIDGVELK
jgi:mRNA-degrading endonuclease RelE of RelBE toxin-antitoxin system